MLLTEGEKDGDAYFVPDLTGFTAFRLAFTTMFQHSQHMTFNPGEIQPHTIFTQFYFKISNTCPIKSSGVWDTTPSSPLTVN
jgi:hypothetical protein